MVREGVAVIRECAPFREVTWADPLSSREPIPAPDFVPKLRLGVLNQPAQTSDEGADADMVDFKMSVANPISGDSSTGSRQVMRTDSGGETLRFDVVRTALYPIPHFDEDPDDPMTEWLQQQRGAKVKVGKAAPLQPSHERSVIQNHSHAEEPSVTTGLQHSSLQGGNRASGSGKHALESLHRGASRPDNPLALMLGGIPSDSETDDSAR